MNKQERKSVAKTSDFYSEIETISATFGQRVIARRKSLNLSQKDLAKMVDVSVNTIQSYEGGSLPRGANFLALAKALYCSLNWLVGMDESGGFSGNSALPEAGASGGMNQSEHLGHLDYFFRPIFLNGQTDESARAVSFNHRWLTEISRHPESLRLVVFKGPSMQPGIYDGDLLMADLSQTAIYSGYLYLIRTDSHQSINRLMVKPSGNLSVVSDNQALCPPYDLPVDQVEIIGRIVWFSRPI